MNPIFEVREMTAGYRRPVVSELSFSVNAGELVGILGRNGEGKTTLLRGITGQAKRFSGQIKVNGYDYTKLSVKKQAALVSVLPQKTYLPEGVTVKEILQMGCYARRRVFEALSPANQEKIKLSAKKLDVLQFLEKDCSKLSVGQQQMVLLCRMFIQDTPVMLLDEPNTALDYSNTQKFFKILKDLVSQHQKAGILVVHDPEIALRWCDRLLILDRGEIVCDLHINLSGEEEIQNALQKLYPQIQVKQNPFFKGYFCYMKED